jgi:putative transcriptional regulator
VYAMENKIAKLRDELCITQEELALAVGISRPYLSDIENDKKNPSCSIAGKIAKSLGRCFDDVFFY